MDTPKRVQHYLLRTGMTIATAESLTAGNVGARIASVSGASAYYLGGVVAYNINQKVGQLGVTREHAETCNCVSPQVAREMAAGCRQAWGTDIAIATTGYAESFFNLDDGELLHHPHAYFAINIRGYVIEGMVEGGERNRTEVMMLVARRVLERLVQFFDQLETGEVDFDPEDTDKLRDLYFQLQNTKVKTPHE